MIVRNFFNSIDCLFTTEKQEMIEIGQDSLVSIFRFFSFKDLTTTLCLVSKSWKNATESPLLDLKQLREVLVFLKSHYHPRSEENNEIIPEGFKFKLTFTTELYYKFNKKEYYECFPDLDDTVLPRQNKNQKQFVGIFLKTGGFHIWEIPNQQKTVIADFLIQENLKLISTHIWPHPKFLLFPFSWKVIPAPNLSPSKLDFITKLQEFIKDKFSQQKKNLKALNQLTKY